MTEIIKRLRDEAAYFNGLKPAWELPADAEVAARLAALQRRVDILSEAAQLLERGSWKPSEGWVLVPREPTSEMLNAAETALSDWRKTLDRDEAMARSYQAHDRRFIASATPAEKHAIRWRAMILALSPDPAFLGEIEEAFREKPDDLERTADKPPNPHGDHRP